MRSLLFILLSFFMATSVLGQDLYMPRDVAQAFKKGTRSPDGKPGKNYWQNHGRYDITITAMPPNRTIKGTEKITYFNNSPDTLVTPSIKLFLNIHKGGAPRNGGALEDYLTSGMHIDRFTIDGQERPWRPNPYQFTSVSVRLPKPLLPGDSIQFGFDWHFDISLQSNREGMIDSTTYFLAYFYPRIAVYDDYNGWDRLPFMEDHEFYSDFNDYTVRINVPKSYLVWGTGTLQQPESVLQPVFAKRFIESLTSDQTIRIVTKEDLATRNVTAQQDVNTWTFTAAHIPDMAFGISDHFVWDGGSVVVDPKTGRRASAQAAYNDTARDYRSMVGFVQHALKWFSTKWPGVPYPYEKSTIFQGYAGMEYPMMANDETYEDPDFSRFVAEHEIAHTYMPFYMGTNETRYGFMDEGWATTFELLIGREDLGVEKAETLFKQFRVQGWISNPSADQDIPIITPAHVLTGGGYGNNMYGKAALGYLAVKDILGDDLFRKCLHAYMDRWNGKHPLPWDFFNTFNNVSGKNLNWFWNNWFFTPGYIDLAITGITKGKSGYTIELKNIGGFAAPTDLVITYADGTSSKKHISPSVWEKDTKKATITLPAEKAIQSVSMDGGIFMDADRSNNEFKLVGEKRGY